MFNPINRICIDLGKYYVWLEYNPYRNNDYRLVRVSSRNIYDHKSERVVNVQQLKDILRADENLFPTSFSFTLK
jgi:hypothetical protein